MFALCSSDCGYSMSSCFKILLPQLPPQDVLSPEKSKQTLSILHCLCQTYVVTATRTETKVEPLFILSEMSETTVQNVFFMTDIKTGIITWAFTTFFLAEHYHITDILEYRYQTVKKNSSFLEAQTQTSR